MGTGRVPPSRRTDLDCNVADWSSAASTESERDSRLALAGQMYAVAECCLRLTRREDIESYYREVIAILAKFDGLSVMIAPLSGLPSQP